MPNIPNNPKPEDVLLTMQDMPVVTPNAKNAFDTLNCRVWIGGVTGSVYIGFFNEKDEMVFRAMTTPEEGSRLIEGIKYAEEMEKLAK